MKNKLTQIKSISQATVSNQSEMTGKEESNFNKIFLDVVFQKSSSSGKFDGNSNCVEVAFVPNAVGVRDSKNPTQSVLQFTRSEWAAFIQGVKAGEFDLK